MYENNHCQQKKEKKQTKSTRKKKEKKNAKGITKQKMTKRQRDAYISCVLFQSHHLPRSRTQSGFYEQLETRAGGKRRCRVHLRDLRRAHIYIGARSVGFRSGHYVRLRSESIILAITISSRWPAVITQFRPMRITKGVLLFDRRFTRGNTLFCLTNVCVTAGDGLGD